MLVLSLFYWMLTKKKTQSLCGDYHPQKTKNSNDGLQLKDNTAYADLVIPSQEIYFFGGLLMSPKFQKWSALKFAGRIIPITEFIGISDTDIRKRSVSELAS